MTDELTLSDDNLDKITSEATSDIESEEEIKEKIKENDREIVNDKSADDEVCLGDLGTFKKVSKQDVDDVFDKLPGTVFQLKKCLFRINYMNRGNKRFTAELLNG